MPSFSSVDWTDDGLGNPIKMHGNQELITDVLKGDLGFDGFVISDWRGIHQLPGDYRAQVKASVMAGIDMFMEPTTTEAVGYQQFIETLISLVEDGEVPMARIDDAVSRILTKKFELGPVREAAHRPPPHRRASAARRTGPLPAGRSPTRRCCWSTEQRTLPLKAAPGRRSTSPAATPTTSATRPAAGPSPGRAARPT